MPFDLARCTFAAALALGLAGCAGDQLALGNASDASWGEANRQTMAAQVIDPDPQYDTAVAVSSGDHAAQAVERYRRGAVKTPEKTTTTSQSGGGGN